MSGMINKMLKTNGGNKGGKSKSQYFGFTKEELKQHLESLFEAWMNWNNYGRYNPKTWIDNDPSTWTWNVDHIVPRSKLPYSSVEEENFKKCWALANLRPYSSKQNNVDGNRK